VVKKHLIIASIVLVMLTSLFSIIFIVNQTITEQVSLENAFRELLITCAQSYFLPLIIFTCFHKDFISRNGQINIACGYIAGSACTWCFVSLGHGFLWFVIALIASFNVPVFGTAVLLARNVVQTKE
jgi:hypothetical protein